MEKPEAGPQPGPLAAEPARRGKSVHVQYDQSFKPYHRVVAELTAHYVPADASILDIGTGVGHTLSELHRLLPEARLSGADIDPTCLEITGRRVALASTFIVRDIDELFALGPTFDAVVMSHTLEHLLRPVDAVRGVLGLLRPGGVLVLAVPNPIRPTAILASLRRRRAVNRGHVYAWDRSHWMNFLENILGLDVLCYAQDFVELPLFGRFSVFRPLEVALSRLVPWLSYSHIAVVRARTAAG